MVKEVSAVEREVLVIPALLIFEIKINCVRNVYIIYIYVISTSTPPRRERKENIWGRGGSEKERKHKLTG